jgi:type IV pilus assembly protein PilV
MIRTASGFTLLESLVALVLLSLGLLGALALLLQGTQDHADALRQATATQLVREMAERIRANPRASARYDTRTQAPRAAACDAAAPCTAEELAAADMDFLLATARASFPGDDTVVSIEFEPAIGNAAPARHAITLRWRGPRDRDGNVVTLQVPASPVAG